MEPVIGLSIIWVGAGLLGLLMFSQAVRGMRRGEFKYRGSWFHKGEDGIGFWFIVTFFALVSLMMIVCSIWSLAKLARSRIVNSTAGIDFPKTPLLPPLFQISGTRLLKLPRRHRAAAFFEFDVNIAHL
jgi:uncharacterized membrane protein